MSRRSPFLSLCSLCVVCNTIISFVTLLKKLLSTLLIAGMAALKSAEPSAERSVGQTHLGKIVQLD